MDSPSRFPESPGPSIFPVSPERLNGSRPPYGSSYLAQSPSMPTFRTTPLGPKSPSRNNTDAHVHAMAASFEQISIKDRDEKIDQLNRRVERSEQLWKVLDRDKTNLQTECESLQEELEVALADRKKLEKEFKLLKRQQAADANEVERQIQKITALEAALKTAKDEIKTKREQLKFSNDNGHEAVKRLEVVKTELKCAKDTLALEKREHEKTRKRSSKDTLKTSQALLNTKEELKSTQKSLSVLRVDYETEKQKREQLGNELFKAQYQREAVEGELLKLQDKLRIVEAERNALKERLDKEDVESAAAAGCIALPDPQTSDNDDLELADPEVVMSRSPKKSPVKERFPEHSDKENVLPPRRLKAMELHEELQQELRREKSLREKAEDQVNFMKMECQFRTCSCRIADLHHTPYIHDDTFTAEMERIKAYAQAATTPPASEHGEDQMEGVERNNDPIVPEQSSLSDPSLNQEQEEPEPKEPETIIAFSPTSGTFRSIPSPEKKAPSRPEVEVVSEITSEIISEADLETNEHTPEPQAPPAETSAPELTSEEAVVDDDEDADMNDEADAESEQDCTSNVVDAPQTPHQIRTITTTIKIPLAFSPSPGPSSAPLPPTPSTISHPPTFSRASQHSDKSSDQLDDGVWDQPFDRAAALEAIRQRRGRARSMAMGNMTPRKQMLEGAGAGVARRDISAPAMNAWK